MNAIENERFKENTKEYLSIWWLRICHWYNTINDNIKKIMNLKLKNIRPYSQRSRSGRAVEKEFLISEGVKAKNTLLAKFKINDATDFVADGGTIINAMMLRRGLATAFANPMKFKVFLFEEDIIDDVNFIIDSPLGIPAPLINMPFAILTFDSDEADNTTDYTYTFAFNECFEYVAAKKLVPSSFACTQFSKAVYAIVVNYEAITIDTDGLVCNLQLSISY